MLTAKLESKVLGCDVGNNIWGEREETKRHRGGLTLRGGESVNREVLLRLEIVHEVAIFSKHYNSSVFAEAKYFV